jgi:hypothetical protein
MANNTELKNAIAQVIKANDNQEITGQVLPNTLIVSSPLLGQCNFCGDSNPYNKPRKS